MRPIGTKKNGMKYLAEDELKRFSQAVKQEKSLRDYLMFALTLRLGLRVQELVNIKLDDISQESAQITIKGLKGGRTRHYDLSEENGYRPERTNEFWRKLVRWLKYERKKIDPKGMNPFLFPSRLHPDKSITVDVPKFSCKKYLKAAGLSADFSIHSLRHTCACQLVRANWSGVRIMNWLRHRSIQSTVIYFETLQQAEDDQESSQLFSQYL